MQQVMARRLVEWSDGGRLPVVVDATSCTAALLKELPSAVDGDLAQALGRVRIVDAVEWAEELLPHLAPRALGRVTIHPGCSASKLGVDQATRRVAQAVARQVHVPIASACCGMAGDRGLLHPELVRSAVAQEVTDLPDSDAYVSSNRTCELGLLHATGKQFTSIVQVLEQQTR